MHYQREGLPSDVTEVFFSDRFYYAASTVRRARGRSAGRSLFVGSGETRDQAIADMRKLAQAGGRYTDADITSQ